MNPTLSREFILFETCVLCFRVHKGAPELVLIADWPDFLWLFHKTYGAVFAFVYNLKCGC